MTLEIFNSLATFGTFVVISATAIAAVVQLRHARGSNQIATLNELRETTETPQFLIAQHFVQTDLSKALEDPTLRYQIVNRAARTSENQILITKITTIGNYYENMGQFVKSGLVDRNLVLEIWCAIIVLYWDKIAPFTAISRRTQGRWIWENFEYLAVLAQDWAASHPEGTYPARIRRIELADHYEDADKKYADSLVPPRAT